MAVMDSEEVLLTRMVCPETTLSSDKNSDFFTSRRSTTASMTRSIVKGVGAQQAGFVGGGQRAVEAALVHQFVPLRRQRVARLVGRARLGVEQLDCAARLSGDLCDAPAHGARANQANSFINRFHGKVLSSSPDRVRPPVGGGVRRGRVVCVVLERELDLRVGFIHDSAGRRAAGSYGSAQGLQGTGPCLFFVPGTSVCIFRMCRTCQNQPSEHLFASNPTPRPSDRGLVAVSVGECFGGDTGAQHPLGRAGSAAGSFHAADA